MALNAYNGTTTTEVAVEDGLSLQSSSVCRFDVQVVNFGASASVRVFLDGTLLIDVSGVDVATLTGLSDIDCVLISLSYGSSTYAWYLSEVIVDTVDTRAFPGLQTLGLTGAGTTQNWNATYSNINGTTISDAAPAYTDAIGNHHQFNVTDPAAGVFLVDTIKIAARVAKSAGSTPTKVSLNLKNGGSIITGTDQACTTGYTTIEQAFTPNPITQSELTAVQLDIGSAA